VAVVAVEGNRLVASTVDPWLSEFHPACVDGSPATGSLQEWLRSLDQRPCSKAFPANSDVHEFLDQGRRWVPATPIHSWRRRRTHAAPEGRRSGRRRLSARRVRLGRAEQAGEHSTPGMTLSAGPVPAGHYVPCSRLSRLVILYAVTRAVVVRAPPVDVFSASGKGAGHAST
jgi:hypothetical protein